MSQQAPHDSERETLRQLLALLASVIFSVVAGFIPTWTGATFSTADQTLLTTALFGIFVLLDVLWQVSRVAAHQARDSALWAIRSSGEEELTNIRARFVEIAKEASGGNDLFVTHFTKEFQRLNRKIGDASDRKELRVVSDYYLNDDSVFEAFFSGHDRPVLRYTWPIDANERLFGEHAWRRYFEVVADMSERSRIGEVRALLVIDDLASMKLPRVEKLLAFYQHRDRQQCRVILRTTFESIAIEVGIPVNYLDFGIYSDRMLFRSEQYTPEYVGLFTKDGQAIATYVKFFDTLWGSVGVALRNPSTAANSVALEELFSADSL